MYETGMLTDQVFDEYSQGLSQFRKVVEACDEFESIWKIGKRPSIETWIRSMPYPSRALFLKELLELEIELRLNAGEVPSFDEYEQRFSPDRNVIERVFQGLAQKLPEATLNSFNREEPTPCRLSAEASLGWVGRYELLAKIGGGGMGVVFRAMQHDAKRIVALKLIRPEIVGGSLVGWNLEAIERFRNEATATASLKHPNIVTVYDVGEYHGRPFYTMEHIEGKSLGERLVDGPIEELAAARYLEQISRGVHQAHSLRLLHRDIKPSNILIDKDDKPLISDFGLVKLIDDSPRPSLTTSPLGTPCYMSPEQARNNGPLGAASDVYNIGATLYELITGRPPFRAASSLVTLRQVCEENPAPPRSLNPAISKDLETICLKCLQKDPARRYPTAEALADDFKRLLHQEPIEARPVGALTRTRLWAKRNPKIAALSLAVYVLLAMLAAGLSLLVVQQNEALRLTKQILVRVSHEYLGKAIPIAEGARTSDALPWLAAAIEIEEQAGVLSEASQARFAAILRQTPKPSRIWARTGPIREAVLSPTGKLVATVSGNEAELWEIENDSLIPGGPLRFDSTIRAILFSPDESLVATALANGELHLSELGATATRHKIKIFISAGGVDKIAFSPSGKEIAASSDKIAGVWSVETGQPLISPLRHADRINAIAFSPIGGTLAVGIGGPNFGNIGDVLLWELSRSEPTPIRLPHHDDVNAFEFSSDGKTLASASYDGFVRVWDTSSGKKRHEWDLGENVGLLALSRDGRRIAAATGDLLHLLEVDEEQSPEPLRHPGMLLRVKFFGDGQKVAAASDDWTTRVWNFSTRDLALPALAHTARITSVDVSADGRFLLSASEDRTAKLWDLACGQGPRLSVVLQAGSRESLKYAIGNRDGRRLLLVGSEGTARVFDTQTGNPIAAPIHCAQNAVAAALHPDGKLFGVIDGSGTAAVWNAETGAVVFKISAEEGAIGALRFSADGSRLITAANPAPRGNEVARGKITIRDTQNGMVNLGPIQADWAVKDIAIDPKLTAVAAFDKNGTVQLWSGVDGLPISVPIKHSEGINQVVFSPDGRFLATAGKDGKGMLWNVSARSRQGWLIHDQAINEVAFSPDGRLVATAGKDRYARIWDVETTLLVGNPMHHDQEVKSVSFSKNGELLLTASGSALPGSPGESIVWETSTGYPVNKRITHRSGITFSRCFEDDATFLTISKNEPAANLWQLPKIEYSRADLITMAEIVSGRTKPEGTDVLVPVPANRLAELHREFRRKNRRAFLPTRDDLLAWRDAEAARCVAMKLHERALVHLNALVEAEPNARDCLARRAKVYAELRRWPQALADFERVASDGSCDLDEAWYPLQVLRVHQGQLGKFRSSCDALQKRYNFPFLKRERNNLAYICALAPRALLDNKQLLKMTEFDDADIDPDRARARQDTRAAVLYRVEHYDEARAILESLESKSGTDSRDAASLSRGLLLAMTYARLDQGEKARALFSKLEPKIKGILEPTSKDLAPSWQERLQLEVLLRESREVVSPASIHSSE